MEVFDLFKKEEINSLKARISQLEKRDEKAKRTIATKQEADRELNEARNKISSLLNEIQTLKKETSTELRFRFSESLSRNRLNEILFLLGGMQSKIATLVSVYLEKDKTLRDVTGDTLNLFDSSALRLIEKIESSTG